MVTIEKLSITGIRSFGDDEEGKQLIVFDKPVTLILGENGCGKSTIIECLRYVTTAKEPTGKSVFVRDPELCSNATVKASVKIRIRNNQDHVIQLMRALQASRIRKGITQKTLDATISIQKPGENAVTISSRCADTAAETIRLLGVSKAILENVIFCSQEDSFWPLETDKALKEKFDQIFDSEKYNKCLKRVKDLQKSLRLKKGELEQHTEYNREKRTAAQAKRKHVNKINKSIDEFKNEQEKLDSQLDPIYEKLRTINKQEVELSKMFTEKETTKAKISGYEREEGELRSRLQGCEFVGNSQELEMALCELSSQSRNTNELKGELQILKSEELRLGKEIGQGLSRMGQLGKAVEINRAKIDEKNVKIQEIAAKCDVVATETHISSYVSQKRKDLLSLQTEHESIEESYNSKVNKARDGVVSKEGEVKRKEEAFRENKTEIDEIRRELASAGESQARREQLASDLRRAVVELNEHQKSSDPTKMASELDVVQNQIKKAEVELSTADKEVRRLQGHAENGRELEVNRTELAKKEAEVRRLINCHQDTFVTVLGFTPEHTSSFKQAVEKHNDKLVAEVRELNKQKAERDGARIALLDNVKKVRTLLQKKSAELQEFHDKVFDVTRGGELDETLNVTRTKVDNLQKEKGDLDAVSHMYKAYIKNLTTKSCCPLCRRDFAAEEEARSLADTLSVKMQQIPGKLLDVEKNLEEKKGYLRKLYDLESLQNKMDALRLEEIPALNSEESEKKSAITKAASDLEAINQKLDRIESNRKMCTNMLGDMAVIDQNQKAVDAIKAAIGRIEPLLPADWSKEALKNAETRRDELAASLKKMEVQRNLLQKKINDYSEKLTVLQSKKHRIQEQEFSLRSKDGQQKSQEERLVVLQSQQQTLLEDLESARAEIGPLKEAHRRLVDELRELKEKNKTAVRSEQNRLEGILSQYRDIERLQRETSDFERRGDAVKLKGLEDDIAQLQGCLKATKSKIENVSLKLGDLAKIEVRRHNLEDNKALREKVREREELKKKLVEIETSFSKMGYEALIKEKRRLKGKEEEIGQRKANIAGQMGALEGQRTSIEGELNSEMYRDIDQRFFEALVTQKVTEAQSQDLHRYTIAMDHAMGVYHKQAMASVNSHIHEYWSKIYRGNDIDSIEIQTDEAESTEKRRLFNYKLVQKKGDTAIDMRNRCSAGQKMLACLIVRMALAEVFSSNCGILTLDEPTTNLDKKNISMLAEALNELIVSKSRLAKSNFQLIIITHDKEFLKQITSAQGVERYIQVSRKRDGTSCVTVCNVND